MKSNKELEDVLKEKFSDLEIDSKFGWEKLAQRLDKKPRKDFNYSFLLAASIVGVLIAVSIFVYRSDFLGKDEVLVIKRKEEKEVHNKMSEDKKKTDKSRYSNSIRVPKKDPVPVNILKEKVAEMVVSAEGNKLEYVLPDSSKVFLNKYSKINITSFKENNRIVKLEGEAYFDVENKKGVPFTVICGQSYVEVIGTAFNVKSFGKDSVEVFVEEGKVKFGQLDNVLSYEFLLPGMRATNNNKLIKKAANTNPNYLLWKTGLLTFNKTKVFDVINTMEEYFNVEIHVSEPTILNCHLSGKFKNPDLKTIFTFLSKTLDITCSKENGLYVLKGNGCK